MPLKRTGKKATKSVSKNTFKNNILKISTRYMVATDNSEDEELYITMKYNHLNDTVNVYPCHGNLFMFKHSSPTRTKRIAGLILSATELAEELKDA